MGGGGGVFIEETCCNETGSNIPSAKIFFVSSITVVTSDQCR